MTKREARKVKWHDSRGFVHDKSINDNDLETSENGPLFSSILKSLNNDYNWPSYWKSLRRDKRTFRATPISVYRDSHFSYDNMLGMYYRCYKKGKVREGLPVFWWWSEGLPYVRLESIFFYYVQNPNTIFKKIIFWYLKKAMRRSLKSPYDSTSGKQKWWLRCQMLPPEFLREATYLIEGMYDSSWLGVFAIYYKHRRDHPIIKAAMNKQKW